MGRPKENNLERAHEIALRFLTHRSRSAAEMRARLERSEIPEEVIDQEMDRLLDSGLLDDADFARQKAAALVRRGLGPKGMIARLASAGVEQGAAETAVEAAVREAGGEKAIAEEAMSRRHGDLSTADRKTRAKAARYLVRKGFSTHIAGSVCGVFSDEES